MLAARPAQATTLTLNFHGLVDLASFGGSDSTDFSGSVTWDPATAPFFTQPNPARADYHLIGSTFSLNGADVTGQIAGGQFLSVENVAGEWLLLTAFDFSPSLSPAAITRGTLGLRGTAQAAHGLHTTALPTNFDFLSTMSLETFNFTPRLGLGFDDVTGFVCELCGGEAPVVPEPTTLTFLSLGLAGVAARLRRSSRAS
jgi:hypothetical protein